MDCVGEAGRRLLRLRQRQLVQAHRDRRRPHLRRHRFGPQRPDRQGCPRRSSRTRPRIPPQSAASASRSAIFTPAGWTKPAVEALGTAPLKPYLDRIDAGQDPRRSRSTCSPNLGFSSPVDIAIFADLRTRRAMRSYADQGGLGMPDRDYYLLKGAKYDAYPHRLPRLYRPDADACGHRGRGGAGRPDHRARDRDREGPLDARAEPRRRGRSTTR